MPRDITLKNESQVDALLTSIGVGMFIFSPEGKILDANSSLLAFFRAANVSALEDRKAPELLRLKALTADIDLSKEERLVREFEVKIPGIEAVYNVLTMIRPFRDVGLGKVLYQGILLEINDRKVLEFSPLPATIRDELTGCFSELYLEELEKKPEQGSCGCIVTYLDHFKHYKDRYGTTLALTATLRMSRFLMRHVRAEDHVVKLANDHFVVLLDGADLGGVQKVSRRYRTAAEGQAPLGFSMGVAARLPEEVVRETIHRADTTLTPVRVLERAPKKGVR